MDKKYLEKILNYVSDNSMKPEEALKLLESLPYEDLDFAKVDNHRVIRTGYPEVIFCPGKTPGQIAEIARRLAENNDCIIATRATREDFQAVKEILPEADYREEARIIVVERNRQQRKPEFFQHKVAVVTAGTADIPVAEEAAITSELLGCPVERIYDVGVAGIHRLFDNLERIRNASVVIVVAGMEGALASVVGGLVQRPVIAVPTSIGYGANFNGLSSLLSMLNSCSNGIGTVNIDNGFGAAYLAANIIRLAAEQKEE